MHHLLQDVHARADQSTLSRLRSSIQTPGNAQSTPSSNSANRYETPRETHESYCQTSFDASYGVHWVWLREHCPLKFTPGLLKELRNIQDACASRIHTDIQSRTPDRMRYQVIGSKIPGVFSLGGDLQLFREKILNGDADSLRCYARDAVDLVYLNAVNYEQPVTTITLLQGQALGGGFEAALAANVIIAERHCKLGFPEVMFNMFPGMGAYPLLRRRLSAREAEQMILSGKTYDSDELYSLGLIDILVEPGEGEQAVWHYIRHHDRHANGIGGFRRAVQAANPLDRHELYRMVDVWVETALALTDRDLAVIDYLLRAQQRLQPNPVAEESLLAHQA